MAPWQRITALYKATRMAKQQAVAGNKAFSPLLSEGVVFNGIICCSGSIGVDPKTGKMVQGTIADRTVSEKLLIIFIPFLYDNIRRFLLPFRKRSNLLHSPLLDLLLLILGTV